MSFYKVFPGLPQDAKLAVIARRASLRRGDVLAIWVAFLDHAAAASPRGSLGALDVEEVAAALEFDSAAIESVLEILRDKKMILADGMIARWNQNQKLSTSRTRAYRARQAAVKEDAQSRARLQQGLQEKRRNRKDHAEGPLHDYR
jgi:hypothetical protein